MVDVVHRHVSDVPFRVVERGQIHPTVHVVQPRVRISFCCGHESATNASHVQASVTRQSVLVLFGILINMEVYTGYGLILV